MISEQSSTPIFLLVMSSMVGDRRPAPILAAAYRKLVRPTGLEIAKSTTTSERGLENGR